MGNTSSQDQMHHLESGRDWGSRFWAIPRSRSLRGFGVILAGRETRRLGVKRQHNPHLGHRDRRSGFWRLPRQLHYVKMDGFLHSHSELLFWVPPMHRTTLWRQQCVYYETEPDET